MTTILNTYVLRAVLLLAGVVIIFLGLNVGFGGIRTLGWQGGLPDFITVNDATAFDVRDNHVRFIGGVWLGVGLLMLAGTFRLTQLRMVLIALTCMIFIGGLARFSAGDASLLLSPAILPSFVLELALFPLLGFWIYRAVPAA